MIKNYRVTTEGDCEGRTTKVLGYAQGEEHIIKKYYDSQKVYGIHLEEINIKSITTNILEEKIRLEKDIKETKDKLKSLQNISAKKY